MSILTEERISLLKEVDMLDQAGVKVTTDLLIVSMPEMPEKQLRACIQTLHENNYLYASGNVVILTIAGKDMARLESCR